MSEPKLRYRVEMPNRMFPCILRLEVKNEEGEPFIVQKSTYSPKYARMLVEKWRSLYALDKKNYLIYFVLPSKLNNYNDYYIDD